MDLRESTSHRRQNNHSDQKMSKAQPTHKNGRGTLLHSGGFCFGSLWGFGSEMAERSSALNPRLNFRDFGLFDYSIETSL